MPFALSRTLDERIGHVDDRIRDLEIGFSSHEAMCRQRKEETQRRFDNLEGGQSSLGKKLDLMRQERQRDRNWGIGVCISIALAIIGYVIRIIG